MIELEPINSLALTLHHAPGVQALLLGSGISRAAGIPTGWEIVLDLIKRLALVQGVTDAPDWEKWYQDTYGKEPSYSEILDAIASTPAERRAVIHGYIEATDDDDIRKPTKAHRAIAKLIAAGAIRVVITTNFDRLLENALRDEGVEPTVIASVDGLLGATPLVHSRCTIVKVHGDYMDARIKNTESELEAYADEFNALLDRIFDEYGLVIAGWSGDWDIALRNAILRCSSRRYPFYWASRGAPSKMGKDLINHRVGTTIPVSDADTFFTQLLHKFEAVRSSSRVHPQTAAIAVAEAKKLSRDERLAPEWADLLACEVDRVSKFVRSEEYAKIIPGKETVNALVAETLSRTEILRRVILVASRWGNDQAFHSIKAAISSLTFADMHQGGYTYMISMRRLAGSLCFYWALCGSIAREDYGRVRELLTMKLRTADERQVPAVRVMPFNALDSVDWKILAGLENNHTPASDFFAAVFDKEASDVVINPNDSSMLWDDTEFVITMQFAYDRLPLMEKSGIWFWAPVGRSAWRRASILLSERIQTLLDEGDASVICRSGLLGGSAAKAGPAITALNEFLAKTVHWY
ncbi:SIR2 family protein [Rhizobium gallicum]|uniref:SIR2 family protein n=1 Tax=Rhizobium gallicum TaxID=56730 RepID=UPI00036FC97F